MQNKDAYSYQRSLIIKFFYAPGPLLGPIRKPRIIQDVLSDLVNLLDIITYLILLKQIEPMWEFTEKISRYDGNLECQNTSAQCYLRFLIGSESAHRE